MIRNETLLLHKIFTKLYSTVCVRAPYGHPPYSIDLAPSDYHLFLHLKPELAGQSDKDVKHFVQQWLSMMVASLGEEGIDKLVEHYDKYLNKYGNIGSGIWDSC